MQRAVFLLLLVALIMCVAGGEIGWGFVRPRWYYGGRRLNGWMRSFGNEGNGAGDMYNEGQ
ncbi:unnamed protein product [Cylicocyclus nassatus]|uniref:Uncharacterized protein n=1 Tax=Cylicocyclus nassatus TaxID=53992 RepID=A0AA36DMR0_CYLNA|nr:unnamed protein product [Cylicocyclus nassatus]